MHLSPSGTYSTVIPLDMSIHRSPATLAREDEARREITEHESCIELLQSQIDTLKQKIKVIEGEQRKHGILIKRCLSVLSLANRLPTEVLVRIFECAVFDGWAFGPLIVSHVCSTWRDASRTPILWTQIVVDAEKMEFRARCHFWFSMARESLLDITFRTSGSSDLTLSAFALINSKIRSWRSLYLDSYTMELAKLALAQISEPAIHLEDVTIAIADSRQPVSQHPWISNLANELTGAPNLRRLTVISEQSSVWFGLPQITSISLQLSARDPSIQSADVTMPDILDVLEASPNLRELSIRISREGKLIQVVVVGQPPELVSLSNLMTLTLEADIAFMLVLKHLDAPNLQKLDLRCPDTKQTYASDEMRSCLQRFLDRSHPPLRSLHLYDLDISQGDFLRIFSEVPSIEDIFLHGSDILDETLLTLASAPFLLPKLRRLEFRWCGHITGEAIEQVVRARSDSASCNTATIPIQEVSLIACSGVKVEAILKISEMCKCWLRIKDGEDICRSKGCCNNIRYRVRFRSRVGIRLTEVQKRNIILI